MNNSLLHNRVFEIFKELCKIPHGSGNMVKIADYCVDFANKNHLKYYRDTANNVIIYKNGTADLTLSAPVILQGHLDMVCQKTTDSDFNFLSDPLCLFTDGDLLGAKNTTLGADNGIAVAYILAVLESDSIIHPPLEAVFTTDEEIGMLGATALDFSKLKSTRMINLDSEEDNVLTVSCAGGMKFSINFPLKRKKVNGTKIGVCVKDFKGGHSGVEIDKNRTNADVFVGALLKKLQEITPFYLLDINGGDKGNAIVNRCEFSVCSLEPDTFITATQNFLKDAKITLSDTEPNFSFDIFKGDYGEYDAFTEDTQNDVLFLLNTFPNGVVKMSDEIEGLVETSLNLGILKTENDTVSALISLRSNKQKGMEELFDKLRSLCSRTAGSYNVGGYYPPWEFKNNSELQKIYYDSYKDFFGKEPQVAAIHAGLECAVFADKIEGLDCISMGPNLFDVHTVDERLSITSAKSTFDLLLEILKNCK